ncbi:MAG: SDR family NAD(P)-dependent oxidoreductase [Candidatus Lokiarchaeota archaeon]|nr:SDR family NAD(P)-dependent oxidoreductase [Candidatus Lokiarchaeota archaeon]
MINKSCLITGAANGIGRAFAKALALEGMNLYLTDIDLEGLNNVKREVEDTGVTVFTGKCDVTKIDDFKQISIDFQSKLGNIDMLLNNAGIAIVGNILEFTLQDWKDVLDVNLWSIIHSIKVFLPKMLERGTGHIVNMASGAGIFGSTEPIPYVASKFAVVGISEALYGQLHQQGIKVSVIVPSYIRTNIFQRSKIRYPQMLIDDIGEAKLRDIYHSILSEMQSKAIPPDRAVKRYIRGIKKDQLYISDIKAVSSILTMKGSNPHQFEEFLINYNHQNTESTRKHFSKFGIDIDKYK